MASPTVDDEIKLVPPVVELDVNEWRVFCDETARSLLGISGEEFLRRWRAGEYDAIADEPGHADIIFLVMLFGGGGR